MGFTQLKRNSLLLIPKISVATGFFSRFMGLMGKTDLPRGEGVCFPRCNSIHTFFMRFPIDVIFVDAKGVVVRVSSQLRPWRLVLPVVKARHVIELKGGECSQLKIKEGDSLECEVWA